MTAAVPRRFMIGSKTYDSVSVNDLSLGQLIELEDGLAALGRPLSTADIQRVSREIQALPENQRADHPQMLLMTAIGVWAAKRSAGEDITFADALDVKITDLKALPTPQDRKAPANPTKARPASARAARARKAAPAASS